MVSGNTVLLFNNNYSYITDVNECETNNGGCSQTCLNTNGSYECFCVAGYTLRADGFGCDGSSIL